MLHGLVQQLGTTRDTAELRGQCRCQMEVIDELREKIKTEVKFCKTTNRRIVSFACCTMQAGCSLRQRTFSTCLLFFFALYGVLLRSTKQHCIIVCNTQKAFFTSCNVDQVDAGCCGV